MTNDTTKIYEKKAPRNRANFQRPITNPRRERQDRREVGQTQPAKNALRAQCEAVHPQSGLNPKKQYRIKHPNETLLSVLKMRQAALNIIPIRTDGSKAPDLKEWKTYQERFATDAEIFDWFDVPNPPGIGIIHGIFSGGSEAIDIDEPALVEAFEKRLEEIAPGLLAKLIVVRTPRDGGGGRHYYYNYDTYEFSMNGGVKRGNQKLAQRKESDGSVKTLIETRGEGGYTIAPGSPAKTHPTGRPYKLIQGEFTHEGVGAVRLTLDERATLLEVAASFNEIEPEEVIDIPRTMKRDDEGVRPGTAFNESPEAFKKCLEAHKKRGAKVHQHDNLGVLMTRPGKQSGVSARLFSNGVFKTWSSNDPDFPDTERGYSPFAQLTTLEHGGDFSACAKVLYADGYGDRAEGKAANDANGSSHSVSFEVTDSGVYVKNGDGKDKWLCSPLHVRARARDENGDNAGLLLEWTDLDGKTRHWTMPRALLASDGAAIREELLSRGFPEVPTNRWAREMFTQYLMTAKPEKVARNTSRIGWHSGAYILPDETIGAPDSEEIVLQSNVSDYRLTVKGSIEEWKENVGKYCEGNSRLLFAASVAFAAPLLRPLGQEGGGFHFRGQSSKGKSTTTIVAGSIYGGGDSTLGFARTWAHTANALEATAETHNDGLLILDELARCDAKDAGNVAYMLASGDGKGRLQSSIRMRKPFKWQLMFLSTGEISLADHAATAGKKTRAGQEVRLIDLPADTGVYGVFENLHGFADGSKFAQTLQQNARSYYGAPLRAYLAKLVQDNLDGIKQDFQKFEKFFTDAASKIAEELKQQVSGEVSRVASRFALVAYAGELATKYGITGWKKKAATVAALKLFKEWLDNRGGTGNADEEAAVSQVRQFLAEYGAARFETGRVDERIIGKRAGFVELGEIEGEKLFCIFPETFRSEVCNGYDAKMVAQALYKRGFLEKDSAGKNSLSKTAPDGTKHRVYIVKSAIFEQ